MMSETNFLNIMNDIRELKRVTDTRPKMIKVNQKWLNSMLDEGFIERSIETARADSFYGIPLKVDNTIPTYELVKESYIK